MCGKGNKLSFFWAAMEPTKRVKTAVRRTRSSKKDEEREDEEKDGSDIEIVYDGKERR